MILADSAVGTSTVSIRVPLEKSERFVGLLQSLGLQFGRTHTATSHGNFFEVALNDIASWCPVRYMTPGPWILELEKETILCLFDFLYENVFISATERDVTRVLPKDESQTDFSWWQVLATLCETTSYPYLHERSLKKHRQLHFNRRAETAVIRVQRQRIPYEGKVYCANMPKDTLIVRNKGFISVVGNCQNFPKKQDKAIKRIMGEIDTIRSCFVAKPGHVLIEADYKSAEIYTLGFLSNCARLLKDAEGDLHARGAVSRFGAPAWPGYESGVPPPESWLQENAAIRVASKTVTFGRMAELKSLKKSGTLKRESEVKVGLKKLTSRNDYPMNLLKQTIIWA
jgi:hypothetical protein